MAISNEQNNSARRVICPSFRTRLAVIATIKPRRRHADAQLPRPEHQVQMILAADLAPDREDRLDGNQEFDDQQRAEKSIVHVARKGKYL